MQVNVKKMEATNNSENFNSYVVIIDATIAEAKEDKITTNLMAANNMLSLGTPMKSVERQYEIQCIFREVLANENLHPANEYLQHSLQIPKEHSFAKVNDIHINFKQCHNVTHVEDDILKKALKTSRGRETKIDKDARRFGKYCELLRRCR